MMMGRGIHQCLCIQHTTLKKCQKMSQETFFACQKMSLLRVQTQLIIISH